MGGPPAEPELTEAQKNELLTQNVEQVVQMDRDAGNMVKQLLFELQNKKKGRNTYIRLRFDPASGDSVVFYTMRQGDPQLVIQLADTLGFQSFDHKRLEV